MKKVNKWIIDNLRILTIIYVIMVSLMIVFLTKRGDDFHFHMMRLNAIANEYQTNGISAFPIRIYSSVLDGYGYASPMFYGDIFMQPFALLTLIGLSFLNAYRLMMLTTFLSAYFVTRVIANKIYNDKAYANIFVCLYVVSAMLYEHATGSAIGRNFATVFVPMVIGGFYLILYKNYKYDWLWLGCGMAGLAFSNMIDFMICTVVLVIILSINIKKLSKEKIGKIIKAIVVCVGFTLWFIMPMIEQMMSQTFFVTSDKVNVQMNNLSMYTVPVLGLLFPQMITSLLYKFIEINDISIAYMTGLLVYILMCIFVITYRKKVLKNKFALSIFIILCFCIWFQTKAFPFEALKKVIGIIQFPYRVQIVMTLIFAILGVNIYKVSNKSWHIVILIFMSLWYIAGSFMCSSGYGIYKVLVKHDKFADYSYTINDIMGGEYLPEKLLGEYKETLKKRGDDVKCDDNSVVVNYSKIGNSYILKFENNYKNNKFELPLIMYKGYVATDLETGEKSKVESSDIGLVQVSTSKEHGEMEIKYEGTLIQNISDLISLLFCIGLLVYLFIDNRKSKQTYDEND